jgi:hypothetical protein
MVLRRVGGHSPGGAALRPNRSGVAESASGSSAPHLRRFPNHDAGHVKSFRTRCETKPVSPTTSQFAQICLAGLIPMRHYQSPR